MAGRLIWLHTGKRTATAYSLPQLMDMDVNTALQACAGMKLVRQRLQVLQELGLGYLTLGEETPSLSGGEAQRLKLASEMGKAQEDAVFVFDEPTIGLHPLDVQTLLGVFQTLMDHGATVVVIEHDLDVIRNADYLIDMGPGRRRGGRPNRGRGHACGTAPGPGEHHRQVSMREIPCFSTKKYGCSGARLASGAAVLCKGYVTK